MTKKKQFKIICKELRVNIWLIKKYLNEGNIELALLYENRLDAMLDLLDAMHIMTFHDKWIIRKNVNKLF